MREEHVEQYLRREVKRAGGLCEKHISPGNAGVPDRLITLDGRMFLVETKAPKGPLREAQKIDHAQRKRCGVAVVVLRTKDEVDSWLRSLLPAPINR